jgi:hypothetical protein
MHAIRARLGRVSSAHLIAIVALVLALGGGSVYAASKINADDIRKGAVRSKQIRNGAVKTGDLGKRAVKRGKIAPGAVGTDQLAAASVTSEKLAVSAQWRDVTLAAGYATFDANGQGFGTFECLRDPFGIVHLRGAVEKVATATLRVGTLPTACWAKTPAAANRFDEFLGTALSTGGTGTGAKPAYVDADTAEVFLEGGVPDNEGVSFGGVALGN